MVFSVTPSAGEVFLYMKNTSDNKIICEGFNIQNSSDEVISIILGKTGTPVNGTDVVPGNLTAGSGNTAIGVFKTNSAITGLSGGVNIAPYHIASSNNSTFRNFDADIMIPKNQTLCLIATNGGIALSGFIVFWHDHSENGGS